MAHSMKDSTTTVEDMDMEQSNGAIIVCLKENRKKINNTGAEKYKTNIGNQWLNIQILFQIFLTSWYMDFAIVCKYLKLFNYIILKTL